MWRFLDVAIPPDVDYVAFAIRANTAGWIGGGFAKPASSDGKISMIDADASLGFCDPVLGGKTQAFKLRQRNVGVILNSTKDSTYEVSSISCESSSTTGPITTLRVKRLLSTNRPDDIQIDATLTASTPMVFALRDEPMRNWTQLQPHTRVGTASINFLTGPSIAPACALGFDFFSHVTMTTTAVTHAHTHTHRMEK